MCDTIKFLKESFQKFESQSGVCSNSWPHTAPPGSIAEKVLQSGRITEIQEVPSIMTLVIPPFVPQHSGGFSLEELSNLSQMKMLKIMGKVEMMVNVAAQSFETAVKAHVVFSQFDQCNYLCAYLENYPSFIFGGRSRLNPEFGLNPDPMKIFEAYRIHFVCSFRKILPPPLYNRMCRIVDHDLNMHWVVLLMSSIDFREIVGIVRNVLKKEEFSKFCAIHPEDFSFKKPDMVNLRKAIHKNIEEESKKFWTYERIGAILKL